jgi:hypothetical protein
MKKFYFAMLAMLFTIPCLAKDTNEINDKFSCGLGNGKSGANNSLEEIIIDVRRINFAKEPNQKPNWGSVSNTKVKVGSITHEATVVLNQKGRVVLSYVLLPDDKNRVPVAKVYEINLEKMRLKKTSLSLFDEGTQNVSSVDMSCTRII